MVNCGVFDESLLPQLDYSKCRAHYRDGISPENLPTDYVVGMSII